MTAPLLDPPTIPVALTDELVEILAKLSHCQDSKSGERSFVGTVRVRFDDNNVPCLEVVDRVWYSEPGGDAINTSTIRV